jgi:hypothetical protein
MQKIAWNMTVEEKPGATRVIQSFNGYDLLASRKHHHQEDNHHGTSLGELVALQV